MEKIAMYKEVIREEAINKIAREKASDRRRDKDTETRLWRDRFAPEFSRGMKTLPRAIAGGIVGMGVGSGVMKSDTAGKVLGSVGATAASYSKKRELEKKDLNRLSNRYFGKDATKTQHETVKNKTIAATGINAIPGGQGLASVVSLTKTPESVIQRARREKQK